MSIEHMDALTVGVLLAIAVSVFGRVVGMDRDRAYYPTALVVIASLYDLFAVMAGSMAALRAELVGTAIFLVAVVVGFRRNLWIVAIGLAAHGLYDFVHPQLIDNPGVPDWWPAFCGAYDVAAGLILGWLLTRGRPAAKPPQD